MSSVETGQMSAVETGQMSAAETGQMSAVETRQMYSIETGSTEDIWLLWGHFGGTKMISTPFLHLKCSKWNSSGGARRCPGVPGGARGCPAVSADPVHRLQNRASLHARWAR